VLALAALLFGGMAVATRAASHELGAPQIAFVRFLFGAAAVGVWMLFDRGHFVATRPWLLAARGLLGGIAVLFYFMAIERLSAGLGTLINYTFPLWAAVFAAMFLGERFTLRLGAALALATTGLVVVVGPGQIAHAFSNLGDERVRTGLVFALVSSIFGGAATTVIRALRSTDSSTAVFLAFCLGGMVVCAPGAFADWRPIGLTSGLLVLAVGALSMGAQLLFTFALQYVTAGAGSLTTQLTVVSSYGFASLFLGEAITPQVLLGGAVVLLGVLLASVPFPVRLRR
jgi:drug/metabolite transporter (DMT)-like permease